MMDSCYSGLGLSRSSGISSRSKHYVEKGLTGQADANKDNIVTVSELGSYIRPKVIKESTLRQNPLYGRLEGSGDMIFIKHERVNEFSPTVEPLKIKMLD